MCFYIWYYVSPKREADCSCVPRRRSRPPLGCVVSLENLPSFVLVELLTALVTDLGLVFELLVRIAETIPNYSRPATSIRRGVWARRPEG